MRILFLIDELITKGGTEHHLFELSHGLARAGHNVTVMCLQEGSYAYSFRSSTSISFQCLNVGRIYDAAGVAGVLKIIRFIRNNHIDVVQTFHTGADLMGPVASLLSLTGPVILSSRRDLGYTKSARHVVFQRLVNCFVDGILSNSEAVRKSVVDSERYPEDKVQIIYNGIHCDRYSAPDPNVAEVLRTRFSLSPKQCVVGSVGNIRPVKGYDLMVEAAVRICRDNRDVIFIHAGEGEGRSDLEARCRSAGIADRFRFLGAQKDIPELLSLMDIYLQPSRTEGFSNAILEAMSAGLPVIGTRVGGTPEVIEEGVNGFMVDAEDVDGMVMRLLPLLQDRELRETVGGRARTTVMERFGMAVMIANYERYYYERLQGVCSSKAPVRHQTIQ